MKRALKQLDKQLQQASSYAEWKDIAQEHDRLSGAIAWKHIDRSPFYDYEMIRNRVHQLRRAREQGDATTLLFHLHEGLHGNLGNISDHRLYQHTRFGTKTLIENYLDEVVAALDYLHDGGFAQADIDPAQQQLFFHNIAHAFGQTALMLSGGAALGLFHIGVAKALWQQDLLPKVISGSSAGAIIAGVIGTSSDNELAARLRPENIYLEAFKYVGWKGTLKGTPVLDGDQLEACLEENIPDMTFEEAFRATGREINITVSPYDRHQKARLLNWRTSPNVLIRKAVLASCAIPGIYPPVTLWAKNINGDKVPYIPNRKWVDGSVKDDLPIRRLARLYGVNHSIVSQTNPHVVPFLARHNNHKLLPTLAELLLKNVIVNSRFVLRLAQDHVTSNDLGLVLDKAESILRQKYIGDINIIPPRRPLNLLRVLTNASIKDVSNYIELGEHSIWPQMEMIRNTTRISRAVQRCAERLAQPGSLGENLQWVTAGSNA